MYVPEHFALSTEQAAEFLSPVAGGDLVSVGPNGLTPPSSRCCISPARVWAV